MTEGLERPFEILRAIDEQCRKHAFELPKQEVLTNYWSGIGFVLAGQYFLAPLGQISEVLHVPEFTAVPGAKSWVRGVANVRGVLLPIMDLQGFLYNRPNRSRRQRLMVMTKDDLVSSVVVDDVFGLQHFEDHERVTDFEESDEQLRPFVTGAFERDGRTWKIFDFYELAENANFLQVAV